MGQTKSRLEEIARERFFGSRLFPVARDAYQRIFNRDKFANRRELLRFYADFIRRGDLVFDVGANVGVYTEVFAALGATVVAVEPNPRCARVLEMLSQRLPVSVERCAISDQPGRQKLQISEVHLLSALAEKEEDASQRSPLHRDVKWLGAIEVEVKTLAQLAAQYGSPKFVKIDAEGVDDRVIAGMDFEPETLSFEYYKHLPDVAQRCMEAPLFSRGSYEFNYVHGFGMKLAAENWLELAALRARLESLAQAGEDYGDVVARRVR